MKGAEIKLRKLVQDSNQIFREILPPTILIKFLVVTRLTKNSEKSVTEIQKMVTNQNGPPETWMKTVKLSIKDICSSKPISKSKVEITKQNKTKIREFEFFMNLFSRIFYFHFNLSTFFLFTTYTEFQFHEFFLLLLHNQLGWKQRWFVLDSTKHELRYYDTREDFQCKGQIDLVEVTRITEGNNTTPGAPKKTEDKCFFELQTRKRDYCFCAETRQAAHEWVSKIQMCLQ